MRKVRNVLAGLVVIAGIVILLYGSIKLNKASKDLSKDSFKVEGVNFEYETQEESRGKSSANLGLMMIGVGVILLFVPIKDEQKL